MDVPFQLTHSAGSDDEHGGLVVINDIYLFSKNTFSDPVET